MSNETTAPDPNDASLTAEEFGRLTVEDEPGTVDPADLAGTASDDDEEVGYEPAFTEADDTEELED
jgi:hypothetical protein